MAVRSNVRAVLENVTLAHIAAGKLPEEVAALARTYRQTPDGGP
jgi:hypothetical protein